MFQLIEKNGIIAIKAEHPTTTPWSEEGIAASFANSAFRRCYLDRPLLQAAVAAVNDPTAIPSPYYPIGQRRDARIDIRISDDGIHAQLILTGAWGGHTPAYQDLMARLQEAGVTFGIDLPKLKQVAAHLQDLKPGQRVKLRIASGRPAEPGQDGHLEQLAPTAGDRLLQPQVLDDGRVDMRDLGALVTISAGTPLMRNHPPTGGKAGITVHGHTIPPTSGRPVRLTAGEGSAVSDSDPALLLATRDGVPVLIENGMKVDDVLVQPKVDIATGHIRFKGAVIVLGDVEEGMRIESDSDVSVGGSVTAASIIAAGDVTIAQGVIGHQRGTGEGAANGRPAEATELAAAITCGGRFRAGFAQYSRIRATGSVHIERMLTHCDTQSQQGVRIGRESRPDGRLIGGSVQLNGILQVGDIGTDVGVRTDIGLAMDYPRRQQRIRELQEQLKLLNQEIVSGRQTIGELQTQSGWEEMIALEKTQLEAHNAQFQRDKQALEQEKAALEQLEQQSAIEIHGTLYPRLYADFNGKRFVSRDEAPRVKIIIATGKPTAVPLAQT